MKKTTVALAATGAIVSAFLAVAIGADSPATQGTTIVTGSSTVVRWEQPDHAVPGGRIENTAVSGSTMDDLLADIDGRVLSLDPDLVLVAAGDNDLAAGAAPEEILATTVEVLDRIEDASPDTRVILTAAKPSPARWELRDQYLALNEGYRALAAADADVTFADTWSALLDDSGDLRPELYDADRLHLSAAGYALWEEAVREAA